MGIPNPVTEGLKIIQQGIKTIEDNWELMILIGVGVIIIIAFLFFKNMVGL